LLRTGEELKILGSQAERLRARSDQAITRYQRCVSLQKLHHLLWSGNHTLRPRVAKDIL
jgi:hypothetical protein